jgi:hypothetical protein
MFPDKGNSNKRKYKIFKTENDESEEWFAVY